MSATRNILCLLVAIFGFAVGFPAHAAETPPAPDDFPKFSFAGHDEEAQLLSNYLWYHFHHRLGNGLTLFNKEYLLFSDTWMNGAIPRGTDTTIQELRRQHLLAIEMDAEGYVDTHQHFSHAHDRGWPFPMWTLAGVGPDDVKGKAVGWHFQPKDQVPGWVGGHLRKWNVEDYFGETATKNWTLTNLKSPGIVENQWQLEATGNSPMLTTPEGFDIDAFNAPYLQLRWNRTGLPLNHALPYVEWLRADDTEFGPDRRVYFALEHTPLSGDRRYHSMMDMYRHPKWEGTIKRMRIALAPGESDVTFDIDSFFTAYDTRHTINNPIFILANWYYFVWTGDIDFLRQNINRMRTALRYQQTVMGGLKYKHIRNTWPNHDGVPGYYKDEQGNVTMNAGHGIGANYWDLMPFGWDDFYATYQYYAATEKMADIEAAILEHPGWSVPVGALELDPDQLRSHAQDVKENANALFWNSKDRRFIASIDKDGVRYDYGYTFVNLDAIWYDIASDKHARDVMDWIGGKRIVKGDTSTGADIYHWRFGPRATTKRNLEWYGQGWRKPESIPWGGQVQDGGAVLGFSFYDLWARLKVLGPDNAWQRLTEILAWEKDVYAAGGYREYYADGKQGTALQGGGTAGGLGIDAEFFESSLIPSIVTYGFLGLDPQPDRLAIHPNLPESCPEMSVVNLLYRNTTLDVRVTHDTLEVTVKKTPVDALIIDLAAEWRLEGQPKQAGPFSLSGARTYRFACAK
ncbi:MAG: glycosyl hydrolase family 65 protein [bacterium]